MRCLGIERPVRHGISLALLVMAVDGCTEPDVRRPFAIGVAWGGGQQGEVGARLPMDIAVQVTDSFGRSVPHALVTFEITPNPNPGFNVGSVEPVSVETDVAGVARTQWTLGTAAGEQTLRAWAGSVGGTATPNTVVSATAQPGAAATVAPAAGGIVAITVGDSARVAIVAKDRYGNVTSTAGLTLTWQVTDPSVASVSSTDHPPDRAAMVVASTGGATVVEARDPAAGVARFDVRTYVGPGRDIAYGADEKIYFLSADGATTTLLGAGRDPAWSPDGRQIAFTAILSPPSAAIYVINADGSARRALTDGVAAGEPSWSPDGRKIAFVREGALFVMNADGSAPTFVLQGQGPCLNRNVRYPTWSPDGSRIAYSVISPRSSGSCGEVFVANADGSGHRPIASTAEVEHRVAWSPDGRRVAFESSLPAFGGQEPTDLYSVNVDGTERRRLTAGSSIGLPAGSWDHAAAWAPDQRIAFARRRGVPLAGSPPVELWVANGDGTEARRVGSLPIGISRLAWRPRP